MDANSMKSFISILPFPNMQILLYGKKELIYNIVSWALIFNFKKSDNKRSK